ncbi:MAG TPA: hypothetical protein VKK79_21050 [Candidatus Lokiarchaeia archaeon]|nr:hypothetical protein [Candidatus Lokiarchaeia archaeon]
MVVKDSFSPLRGADDAVCPSCGAQFPIMTENGAICRECGLVLDELVLDCRPALGREGPILQSEVFRSHLGTRVGMPREALNAPQSIVRANKYATDFASHVLQCAAAVIRDALERFSIDTPGMFDACHAAFVKMYHALPARSPCRNVDILALAAIFRTAQIRRVAISCRHVRDMLLEMGRPPAAFRSALQMTADLFPRAPARDVVLTLAGHLASRLGLPAPVAALAVRIARTHGKLFATRSKASVAAAAVVASAVLARGIRSDFPISLIAEVGGVATSAVSRSIGTVCATLQRTLPTAVAWAGPILASIFDAPIAPVAASLAPELREPISSPASSKNALDDAGSCLESVSPSKVVEPVGIPLEKVAIKLLPEVVECECLKTCISTCGTAGHYCLGRWGSEFWNMNLVNSHVTFAKSLLARSICGHLTVSPSNLLITRLIDWAGLDPPLPPPA